MALCTAFFFVIRVSNRLSSCSANHKQRLRHVTSFEQSENRSVLRRTGRHLKDFPDAVKNKTKKKLLRPFSGVRGTLQNRMISYKLLELSD